MEGKGSKAKTSDIKHFGENYHDSSHDSPIYSLLRCRLIFRFVTQHLRDEPKKGCEEDYPIYRCSISHCYRKAVALDVITAVPGRQFACSFTSFQRFCCQLEPPGRCLIFQSFDKNLTTINKATPSLVIPLNMTLTLAPETSLLYQFFFFLFDKRNELPHVWC